jgi:hypothetical protein
MPLIPLAIINCAVVELLLQVFALVHGSYGEQHCITSPNFLSIGNNIIPLQLLQRTTKVMLAPNLNLSMLLSQYAETIIPTYEILQTPLSCYRILLYVKERSHLLQLAEKISSVFLWATLHRVGFTHGTTRDQDERDA